MSDNNPDYPAAASQDPDRKQPAQDPYQQQVPVLRRLNPEERRVLELLDHLAGRPAGQAEWDAAQLEVFKQTRFTVKRPEGDRQLSGAEVLTVLDALGRGPGGLVEREQLLFGHVPEIRVHAVHAAEVAAIGDRKAKVADHPAVRVDQMIWPVRLGGRAGRAWRRRFRAGCAVSVGAKDRKCKAHRR